jgi:hypothetical protein
MKSIVRLFLLLLLVSQSLLAQKAPPAEIIGTWKNHFNCILKLDAHQNFELWFDSPSFFYKRGKYSIANDSIFFEPTHLNYKIYANAYAIRLQSDHHLDIIGFSHDMKKISKDANIKEFKFITTFSYKDYKGEQRTMQVQIMNDSIVHLHEIQKTGKLKFICAKKDSFIFRTLYCFTKAELDEIKKDTSKHYNVCLFDDDLLLGINIHVNLGLHLKPIEYYCKEDIQAALPNAKQIQPKDSIDASGKRAVFQIYFQPNGTFWFNRGITEDRAEKSGEMKTVVLKGDNYYGTYDIEQGILVLKGYDKSFVKKYRIRISKQGYARNEYELYPL